MSIAQLGETPLKKGEIAFLWFNNSSGVVIKTPRRVLVIDPVDVNPDVFIQASAVLVTHEHYDHLDESIIGDIFSATNCQVIADSTSLPRLADLIKSDKLIEARVGEEIEVDGVTVNVEHSNHPPAATPVSFVITSEDGVTVFHTSDSLPFGDMQRIGRVYKPDITFCTIGIAPGASPRTGVEIAKQVQPKVAVPYHGTEQSEFARILAEEAANIKCMLIQRDKVYKYP